MPGHRRPLLLAMAGLAGALTACSGGAPAVGQAGAGGTPAPSPGLPQASAPAGSIPVAGHAPVAGVPWYLAIGDSITFGYSADPARAGVNSSWALLLQPMLAASGRPWQLYDTACVAERTDTYYTRCPGRALTPFLADTSQHDAALAAITAHRADLRAIFVDLGSNDLLRALQRQATLPAATSALRTALTRIVRELRAAAPGVPVIICNYYNPFANIDPATRPQVTAVNAVVSQVAAAQHARLADFYAAVDASTPGVDSHLCKWVDCAHGDIHPTVAGQQRMARVALQALGPA
jgi:lysophospholipase L1-like esterase